MRLRKLAAGLALTVAALASLSACTSKLGEAASVGGHRISDSTITTYLTDKAVPFEVQNSDGSPLAIFPKSYTLQLLVTQVIFERTLAGTKGGTPSAAAVTAAMADVRQGESQDAFFKSNFKTYGFRPSFGVLYARVNGLGELIGNRVGATQANGTTLILAAIAKQHIAVSVSGRYGKWDASELSLTASTTAGLPAFVKFAPAPSLSPSSAATPSG